MTDKKPSSRVSSISDDDPILDFTPTQVTMPLDDGNPQLMVGQVPMCRTCRLLSKPMCLHNSPIRNRIQGSSPHGPYNASHGYEALVQEDGHQELQPDLEGTHCHGHRPPPTSSRQALIRLALTSGFCFFFMVAEWVGGYLANSLAIMSDAAHLLSDFGSFLLSMFAIWLSMRRPTQRMTFGYYRAEILGAVTSVLTIWVVTAVLVYMACKRMAHGHYDIDADTMLVVAGIGVLINIIMGAVLHGFCLGSGGHGHSHGLGGGGVHAHGSGHAHGAADVTRNINVRAATVHVLGDLIQSIGVLVASLVIKFKPELRIADPICTLFFSAVVMATTIGVMRDAVQVLMEATPPDIKYSAVLHDLETIEGVVKVHDLNVWSLSVDRYAVSAHLVKDTSADGDQVLRTALALLRQRHRLGTATVQVEPYDPQMDDCDACLLPAH